MAIEPSVYSSLQFKAALVPETTLGTANTTSMLLINLDSPVSITHNPAMFTGIRSGDGRIAKAADIYVSQYGQEKTISFSSLYTTDIAAKLFENLMGVTVGTSPASYNLPYNYTGPTCYHGKSLIDATGSLTFAHIVPEGNNTEIFPGCFIDELKVKADTATDGGRFHFDVTMKTRYNAAIGQAAPSNPTAYGTTARKIYDLAGSSAICQIGGVDVVLESIELNFKSNVQFYGFGVDGIPQTMGRGIPEFEVTGIFGVKFDANSVTNVAKFLGGTTVAIAMHNNDWSLATFGFKGDYAKITSDLNIEEVKSGAFVKIPVKFTASTSGNVIQVIPCHGTI